MLLVTQIVFDVAESTVQTFGLLVLSSPKNNDSHN